MSSGHLPHAAHPELFRWADDLDPGQYLRASYRVSSVHDGEATAIGMAMEQSAATTRIAGYVTPAMLTDWTIRVVTFADAGTRPASEVDSYHLATEVYADTSDQQPRDWLIELAIPLRLLQGKPAQLFNVVVGELPRLGFLSRFRLERCRLPDGFGPGPAFGVSGLRHRFQRPHGPLLCRSMRPAVGLDTDTMARMNTDALRGGFHLVKDDELQVFVDTPTFRHHVQNMLAARDRARDHSGEHKGYIANLICEPDELGERWELCTALGVDAVLVSPFIQGLGTLRWLARQKALPILSHNSFSDLALRHSGWGISYPVANGWQEALGADWFVTEGAFADHGGWPAPRLDNESGASTAPRAMPIIQGGKTPQGLPRYRAAIGSDDYMMIVASWVDSHPAGLIQAAELFRAAIDSQPPLR